MNNKRQMIEEKLNEILRNAKNPKGFQTVEKTENKETAKPEKTEKIEKPSKIPPQKQVDHSNHRQRLLKTVTQVGLEQTNDIITLEFVLTYVLPRIDTNPLAHRLIDKFGNLAGVLDASLNDLLSVHGLGKNAAQRLKLLPQIFWRYNRDKQNTYKTLNARGIMIKYCASLLETKPVEQLYAICLTKGYKVISVKCLAEGTDSDVAIDKTIFLREILSTSETKNVILTHSHPDGNCQPSRADIVATAQFKDLLENVGINLVEHVIVGTGKCHCILDGRTYVI